VGRLRRQEQFDMSGLFANLNSPSGVLGEESAGILDPRFRDAGRVPNPRPCTSSGQERSRWRGGRYAWRKREAVGFGKE
jgi:hypothetical protein